MKRICNLLRKHLSLSSSLSSYDYNNHHITILIIIILILIMTIIVHNYTGNSSIGKRTFTPLSRTNENNLFIEVSQQDLKELRKIWLSKLLLMEQWNCRKLNMMKTGGSNSGNNSIGSSIIGGGGGFCHPFLSTANPLQQLSGQHQQQSIPMMLNNSAYLQMAGATGSMMNTGMMSNGMMMNNGVMSNGSMMGHSIMNNGMMNNGMMNNGMMGSCSMMSNHFMGGSSVGGSNMTTSNINNMNNISISSASSGKLSISITQFTYN